MDFISYLKAKWESSIPIDAMSTELSVSIDFFWFRDNISFIRSSVESLLLGRVDSVGNVEDFEIGLNILLSYYSD